MQANKLMLLESNKASQRAGRGTRDRIEGRNGKPPPRSVKASRPAAFICAGICGRAGSDVEGLDNSFLTSGHSDSGCSKMLYIFIEPSANAPRPTIGPIGKYSRGIL